MAAPIFPIEPATELVADASAIINLIASGLPVEILRSLPCPAIVTSQVLEEIGSGRISGHGNFEVLSRLASDGELTVVDLSDQEADLFALLTIGSGPDTLDDGEAATIAYAVTHGALAVIDERKATRLCTERFPELRLQSTVDLFAHPSVTTRLGQSTLADAVFQALRIGRMRVHPRHHEWVVDLIGPDRAVQCHSLPKIARTSFPLGQPVLF